jgi:hypothetical protein
METFLKQMEGHYNTRCGNKFQISCHHSHKIRQELSLEDLTQMPTRQLILPCSPHLYFGLLLPKMKNKKPNGHKAFQLPQSHTRYYCGQ